MTDMTHIRIEGVVYSKRGKIVAKMSNNCIEYVLNRPQMLYEIKFEPNKQSYQLQHLALHYMNEHKIFDCLINNAMYDRRDQLPTDVKENNLTFRYKYNMNIFLCF